MHIDPNGVLRGLSTQTLFSDSDLPVDVLVATVMPLYRRSFRLGVWQEDLSVETVIERLKKNFSGNFRGYFLFGPNETCIAASWYEFIDIDKLIGERGQLLYQFVENQLKQNDLKTIVWYAGTQVDPDFGGQGIASMLKKLTDINLTKTASEVGGVLIATRLRDDNIRIININTKLGYQRTGLRMPCTLEPSISHEYWYKIIK